jgi:putative membrane protein
MPSDPRYYLAAERTFLAWIRTGIAMMGLGFVVARFGLFVREIQVSQPSMPVKSYGVSFWFGTAFIVLGAFINLASIVNHTRVLKDIREGGTDFEKPSTLAITVALVLAFVGLTMTVYLVSVR